MGICRQGKWGMRGVPHYYASTFLHPSIFTEMLKNNFWWYICILCELNNTQKTFELHSKMWNPILGQTCNFHNYKPFSENKSPYCGPWCLDMMFFRRQLCISEDWVRKSCLNAENVMILWKWNFHHITIQ